MSSRNFLCARMDYFEKLTDMKSARALFLVSGIVANRCSHLIPLEMMFSYLLGRWVWKACGSLASVKERQWGSSLFHYNWKMNHKHNITRRILYLMATKQRTVSVAERQVKLQGRYKGHRKSKWQLLDNLSLAIH